MLSLWCDFNKVYMDIPLYMEVWLKVLLSVHLQTSHVFRTG